MIGSWAKGERIERPYSLLPMSCLSISRLIGHYVAAAAVDRQIGPSSEAAAEALRELSSYPGCSDMAGRMPALGNAAGALE
jgi:hypothetical protein